MGERLSKDECTKKRNKAKSLEKSIKRKEKAQKNRNEKLGKLEESLKKSEESSGQRGDDEIKARMQELSEDLIPTANTAFGEACKAVEDAVMERDLTQSLLNAVLDDMIDIQEEIERLMRARDQQQEDLHDSGAADEVEEKRIYDEFQEEIDALEDQLLSIYEHEVKPLDQELLDRQRDIGSATGTKQDKRDALQELKDELDGLKGQEELEDEYNREARTAEREKGVIDRAKEKLKEMQAQVNQKCEYDAEGYNDEGFDENGFNEDGFGRDGYDKDGYDEYGYDEDGVNRFGNTEDDYNENGYDKDGFDEDGFDEDGYNEFGYRYEDYGEDGYNEEGYNQYGYDKEGYDEGGYDKDGYDRDGNARD